MPKLVAALLAAVLAALALVACGGGGSSTTSESSSTEAPTATTGKSAAPKQGESQPEEKAKTEKTQTKSSSSGSGSSGDSGSSGSGADVPPLKVSGGGSSQVRTKGGDNSIQEFGGESDESELREAAEALHGFYVARAEEEWDKACSYLTKATAQQFEKLASQSPQLKGAGCGAVLHAFTRPLPPSATRETTQVDAISLRQDGERAFLIYRGAEDKPYAIPMTQEDGAWKVAGLAGTPLD
jgi:hypothetical protein